MAKTFRYITKKHIDDNLNIISIRSEKVKGLNDIWGYSLQFKCTDYTGDNYVKPNRNIFEKEGTSTPSLSNIADLYKFAMEQQIYFNEDGEYDMISPLRDIAEENDYRAIPRRRNRRSLRDYI